MAQEQASKASDLITRLNDLHKPGSRDQFAIRRVEKEVESLRDVDRDHYYEFKGIIATLRNDPDEMSAQFKKALNITGFRTEVSWNFAISLSSLGFYIEARKNYEKILDDLKGNPEFLFKFINISFVSGHFIQARDMIQDWKKLIPNEKFKLEKSITECANFLVSEGISENQVEWLSSKVEGFLHNLELYDSNYSFSLETDDNSHFVAGIIGLPKDVDEIVEINLDYSNYFSGLDAPKDLLSKIHFLFVSMEETIYGDKFHSSIQAC